MASRPARNPLVVLMAVFAVSVVGDLGALQGEEAGGARRVTIAATGDVLFHGPVLRSARGYGDDGFRRALSGLETLLGEEELAFANLEAPLTTRYNRPRGGRLPIVGGSGEVAGALAKAGIDVVSVANNHAYDQGAEGLLETLGALEQAGVGSVGGGRDLSAASRPWLTVRGGVRVAFLAFTGPMNRLPRRSRVEARVARLEPVERVLDAVEAARADADLVVVSLHWGHDFQPRPAPEQRRLARRLVEAGADVILGTGPHILHEVERLSSDRGDALVAYSLGNLISPQGYLYRTRSKRSAAGHPAAVDPRSREGVVLKAEVILSATGSISIPTTRAFPLWTSNNYLAVVGQGVAHDIRVIPLAAASAPARRWSAMADALGPAVRLERE